MLLLGLQLRPRERSVITRAGLRTHMFFFSLVFQTNSNKGNWRWGRRKGDWDDALTRGARFNPPVVSRIGSLADVWELYRGEFGLASAISKVSGFRFL